MKASLVDREAEHSRRTGFLERHWDSVILAVVLLPMLWPLLQQGLPGSADGALHVMRLLAMDSYLHQGQMLPRWSPDLVGGFGYPVFSFYSPASFYLAEIPRLLGFDVFQSVAIAFGVMLIAAALGMRALIRVVMSQGLGDESIRWVGLVGAIAYGYTPYLLQNVYLRSAIGEAAAQALLPWILWAFNRLATAERPLRYFVPATVFLAGLALTHNITLILFPPLLIAFCVIAWWRSVRTRARALWLFAAGATAVLLSAFFWAPLIAERALLSNYAYGLSASLLIPENIWNWTNFLDPSLAYHYALKEIPFKIGLLQLILAVSGGALLVRRSRVWWFWIAVAVCYALFAGKWAEPLWLNNDVLLVMQFPWRVLSILALPFAILTAGLVAGVAQREGRPTAVGALLVMTIVICQAPRVTEPALAPPTAAELLPSSINTFEVATGAWGTGSAHEFMPRWVTLLALDPTTVDNEPMPARVRVLEANPWSTRIEVSAQESSTLRLTDFYFPGWSAVTDTGVSLPVRPTTSLGLLTIDVPPGDLVVEVAWGTTPVRRFAEWLSLLTLVLLVAWAALAARTERATGVAATALLPLLAMGLYGQVSSPGVRFDTSTEPVSLLPERLTLAGLSTERVRDDVLILHPYWYVSKPIADTLFTWGLRDASGHFVARIESLPVYGSRRATDWPGGTLVDDRYQISLPPGLAEGTYDIVLGLSPVDPTQGPAAPEQLVGRVTLASVAPAASEAHEAVALINERIELGGGDLFINAHRVDTSQGGWAIVRPGDVVRLDLVWRPVHGLFEAVKSFVHLTNGPQSIAKSDQTPGSVFRPASLWNLGEWAHDTHEFRVGSDAQSGIYDLIIGVYVLIDPVGARITTWPISETQLPVSGDTIVWSRLKYLAPPMADDGSHVIASFGQYADLIGVEVTPAGSSVAPGSTVTVHLVYRAKASAPVDLTQFLHLYSAEAGLMGQVDGPPANGNNPTSSWQPGEIITDTATLVIKDDAPAGSYSLVVGYYDPLTGERTQVLLPDGTQPSDRAVLLKMIDIAP